MTSTLHIYTRVSSTIQETEGTSLKSQEERGINKAKELGFEYKLWNEGGQSSRYEDLNNRPILRKLLLSIEDGKVEHVFVFNTDRLSRNQRTWGGIRWKLKQNRVKLHTPSGVIDLSSSMDDLIIGILSEISQYDNALRSERSQIGKLQKVKKGFWMGGPPPYGYSIKDGFLIENVDESHWVKWIFSEYLNGTPIRKIKAELDRNGVSTRHNKGGWSLGSLQKVLRNTFYIGHYRYSDKKLEETIQCESPSFLPETVWNRAQDKRKQTLKRKGQINKTKHFYMLRDLMHCGHCGRPMSGRKNIGKREQHYYCPDKERSWVTTPPRDDQKWLRGRGCDMIKSLNIPRTNSIVFETVLNTLQDTTELHDHLSVKLSAGHSYKQRRANIRKTIKDLEVELDIIETSLVDIETDVRTQKMDRTIYERVKANLTEQRQELLESHEQSTIRYDQLTADDQWLSALSNMTIDTDRFDSNFTDKKKRDWLSKVVERIDVNYLHDSKEHEVNLRLKIPLFTDKFLGIQTYKNADFIKRCPRTVHSTVEKFVSSGVICENILDQTGSNRNDGFWQNSSNNSSNNVFVKTTINIRWTGFWISTYTEYQKFISDKIISCWNDGWTFKRIAEWFNTNNFKTPRGKVFSDRHVHGILKKRKARDDRFFRDPVVTIRQTDLFYGIDD